ncbi:MAG: hypothetical protein AB8F74_20785 [Saprospiraceae bacterium]
MNSLFVAPKNILFLAFLFFSLQLAEARDTSAISSANTQGGTVFSSFYNEDCLNLTIESNFQQLIDNKNTDTYQKAKVSYKSNSGELVQRDIKIKPRGKSRRRACDIPPFFMKFSKKDLLADGLMADHKLKVVTHCLESDAVEGEQNILKEFLTYKMLNELTDKSFRVQLVRISYLDTETKETSERFGFVIESSKELSRRLNSSRLKDVAIETKDLEQTQYNTVAMFQYMISNTDWQIPFFRNVKIYQPNEGGAATVVPYDFDFAGLVDAEYAVVNPDFAKEQEDIRDRIFLGHFESEAAMQEILDLFKQKKEAILSCCKDFTHLSDKNKKDVINYLEGFYKSIEKKRIVKRDFLNKEKINPYY